MLERYYPVNKRRPNNPDAIILALSTFIFENAESSIVDFEQKDELKEVSKEFNAQPFLKRFLDFSILYFWAATIACESHYDHEDFLKICDGIEKNISKRFSEIEKEQEILGVVLKDYVKDKDELALFYRQFPVDNETKVNFNVLFEILITKRLFDYNSTLPLNSVWQIQKTASYFCKHVFGRTEFEYEHLENTVLHATFTIHRSSFSLACTKLIVEIENLLANNPDWNFNLDSIFRIIKKKQGLLDVEDDKANPFIKTLKNLVISEEDCGTANGVTVSSIMRDGKVIKNLQDRIIHRFALEQIINIHTNQKILRGGEEITKEKLELINSTAGINKIRIRSALTCESEKGVCLKCYGRNNIVGNSVKFGEDVGLEAAYFWNEIIINEEIKELLSPKPPQDSAILSEIDGIVELKERADSLKIISVRNEAGLVREYHVPQYKNIQVRDKESVIAGQQLTSGKISSHEILRICGTKKLLDYLTQEILPYLSMANFDERLIELLLRQVIKIEIEMSEETRFSSSQVIDTVKFLAENTFVVKRNKQPAVGTPIFIGIRL